MWRTRSLAHSVIRATSCLFLLVIPVISSGQSAPRPRPFDVADLTHIVDSIVTSTMQRQRIPGVAVAFVADGKVVLAKGYGFANVERRTPIVPDSTLFRIGSITKLFTATATMQLAERGLVRLDGDVNTYLRRARVPSTYPQPITVAHLLSHTSGLDEIRPGTQAASEAELLPLAEFLGPRLVRARPPGEVPSYSTYGMTLAGLLVEEVSGQSFETYLRERIWHPLGMTQTTITLTPELRARLATAYELRAGAYTPAPYEWYHTTPASSINATAIDMAKFIIAHLGSGQASGVRILGETAARDMERPQARGHRDVPGFGYGFFEDAYFGEPAVQHGGTVAGVSTGLVLLPRRNIGFFVASTLEGSPLSDELEHAVIERYFAASTQPPARNERVGNLGRFSGTYRWDVYCRSCGRPAPTQGPAVSVNDDGTLSFAGQRWQAVDSLLFRRVDGAAVIGFRADAAGRITHLFIPGPVTFEKIPAP